MRGRLLLLLAGLLAGCGSPQPVRPALWEVTGLNGEQLWLLGTIHAFSTPVALDSPAFDKALRASDRLVLEVAAINDDGATAQAFAARACSPGQPPLQQRVPTELVAPLNALLKDCRAVPPRFTETETWAAALLLGQCLQGRAERDSANGIDRALATAAQGKPVQELEGAAAQLDIFDQLAESDQRDLLAAVIRDAPTTLQDSAAMEAAWANGDVAALDLLIQRGFLTDPGLRKALLVDRNRAWLTRLEALLANGAKPFVAVGAAHLVGVDGLPAQLALRGYTVRRIQ